MARTETELGARLSEVEDFIARYLRDEPHTHISGEEAVRHYDIIVSHLLPREFEDAATAAFERMGPEMRTQLCHFLQMRGREQGYDFPELSNVNEPQFRDARQLARIILSLEVKQAGVFRDMMTDGGDRGMGDLTRERGMGFGKSPLFKAVMGGIAAMGMATLVRTLGTPEGRPAEHP
jgi:hypothetical protein